MQRVLIMGPPGSGKSTLARQLGARLGVPVVADLGSGLLAPEPLLPDEPDAATALRAGADLVTGSGDKLLGGPQAGLLLGRTAVVERLRCHPLARALRVDKLTLAALEATLRGPRTPTDAGLHADPALLRRRGRLHVRERQQPLHGVPVRRAREARRRVVVVFVVWWCCYCYRCGCWCGCRGVCGFRGRRGEVE